MKFALGSVWVISGIICSPRLYYVTTFQVPLDSSISTATLGFDDEGSSQLICAPNRNLYDSQTSDMIHFFILFLIPLILMTFMYAQIGKLIWQTQQLCVVASKSTELSAVPRLAPPSSSAFDPVTTSLHSFGGDNEEDKVVTPTSTQPVVTTTETETQLPVARRGGFLLKDERKGRVLEARQAVIRMLIAIVFTFAVCNFPYHLRKICQYYMPDYDYDSYTNQILLPVTFLLMYSNCAISPILYAVMSPSFRQSLKELWAEMRLRFGRRRRRGENEEDEGTVEEDNGVKYGQRDYEQISV